MRAPLSLRFLSCVCVISVAACSSNSGGGASPGAPVADAGADTGAATPPGNAPTVAFADLAEYSGLRQTVEVKALATDDVGLSKLELFAETKAEPLATKSAAPFDSLTWDTTTAPEGIVSIFLRATNTAGRATDTKAVKVIVYNQGQAATLGGGGKGTQSIPANYDPAAPGEIDAKLHWTNPAGIHRFVGVLEWQLPAEQSPWELEFAMGSGECPDNGAIIGKPVASTTSPILVEALPTGTQVQAGMHFAHVKPKDAVAHKGQSLPFAMRVYLFSQ